MNQSFEKAIEVLKQNTNLDIDIYNMSGNIVATTSKEEKNFKFVRPRSSKFSNGIFCDVKKDITYFLISTFDGGFWGIIAGSNEISKNYAFMISNIIGEDITVSNEYKSILLGEFSPSRIRNFAIKHHIGANCVVCAIRCDEKKTEKIFAFLKNDYCRGIPIIVNENIIAYLEFNVDQTNVEVAKEIANSLCEIILEKMGFSVHIGFGNVTKDFGDIYKSFNDSMLALSMGLKLGRKNFVHSHKEFVLSKIVENLNKATIETTLETFLTEDAIEMLEDSEMMETAEEFLENSLNISQTSRVLYMHRNTLMYRLDKIERAIGLNIRNFDDAVTFRLVRLLYFKSRKS